MLPHTPELARKTAEVLALRHIVRMRLTAQQTAAALDVLRELQRAERTARTRAERALDDERQALLAATHDQPPVPVAGERMREIGSDLRTARLTAWRSLDEAIGPGNGRALRSLIQGAAPAMPIAPGMLPMGAPGQPAFPGRFGGPPAPGDLLGGLQPPDGGGVQPGQPIAPGGRPGQPGIAQRPRAGRPGAPGMPPAGGFPGMPGQPGGFLMPPSPWLFPGAMAPGALPLDDIVDLLEKRLAALRS
ncbi:MAG TPA: hypothetical protein VLH79_08075 [Chthonomonadales bacterium]|nr:hypothetical protein [Chthonomonadales bacterium]